MLQKNTTKGFTIVAYAGISDRAEETSRSVELAQWKRQAALYRVENGINDCPANYVFVYGNSALGTDDFCVMKYEAKNVDGVATSQAADRPWSSISQTDAVTQSANAGGHLITDAEWMTIAADIMKVKYNWTDGKVGAGFVQKGYVYFPASYGAAASEDDSDIYFGIARLIYGTTSPDGSVDYSTPRYNSSRVHYLSSGEAIWDISGNYDEWTSDTITGALPGASGYACREYTSISSWGNLPIASRPSALNSVEGLENIASWDSAQGIGQICSDSSVTETRGLIRGGFYYGALSAGVLSLRLHHTPSTPVNSVSFRVVR